MTCHLSTAVTELPSLPFVGVDSAVTEGGMDCELATEVEETVAFTDVFWFDVLFVTDVGVVGEVNHGNSGGFVIQSGVFSGFFFCLPRHSSAFRLFYNILFIDR